MKATINPKGEIEVVDPDTGVIELSQPLKTNEDVFKVARWMQRTKKAIEAMKPIIDNVVAKRIEDNGGPLEFGDQRLIFKSFQTFRIPADAVLAAFEDKDQAIIVLTEAMREDAVTESGIKRLVKEGSINEEEAGRIVQGKVPGPARAYSQVEKHKFDEKGPA